MKTKNGSIRLITLIGVVIVIILLVILGFYLKKDDKDDFVVSKNQTEDNKIKSSSSDFSIRFLQMEDTKENMVYSPLSIKYALKMLEEGAQGTTKQQISNVLKDLELTTYENVDKVLSLANKIYIKNTYQEVVKNNYLDILKNKYKAEIGMEDFTNVFPINDWIENKTLGLIKNMLNDEDLTPDLKVMLINALAIDMKWKEAFKSENTKGRDFYLENGQKVIATMLEKQTSSDDISYYVGDDVTAVSMDLEEYEQQALEFVAIMPTGNITDYIKNLSQEEISKITKKLVPSSNATNGIQLTIPKFKFDYDLKLIKDLKDMGITDAFDPDIADFSNMVNLEEIGKQGFGNLYVGDAKHKATIDFSEKGIKAAAVTIFAMKDNAIIVAQDEPILVEINRPFVFLIKDKNTGEIWFVGSLYEPNLWEKDKSDYGY